MEILNVIIQPSISCTMQNGHQSIMVCSSFHILLSRALIRNAYAGVLHIMQMQV